MFNLINSTGQFDFGKRKESGLTRARPIRNQLWENDKNPLMVKISEFYQGSRDSNVRQWFRMKFHNALFHSHSSICLIVSLRNADYQIQHELTQSTQLRIKEANCERLEIRENPLGGDMKLLAYDEEQSQSLSTVYIIHNNIERTRKYQTTVLKNSPLNDVTVATDVEIVQLREKRRGSDTRIGEAATRGHYQASSREIWACDEGGKKAEETTEREEEKEEEEQKVDPAWPTERRVRRREKVRPGKVEARPTSDTQRRRKEKQRARGRRRERQKKKGRKVTSKFLHSYDKSEQFIEQYSSRKLEEIIAEVNFTAGAMTPRIICATYFILLDKSSTKVEVHFISNYYGALHSLCVLRLLTGNESELKHILAPTGGSHIHGVESSIHAEDGFQKFTLNDN
ncbi:hypothetical protein WN51_05972 [Melipona quadrifasciata]|uniref:Uncharacterized protein n=1 Tax=Melipona quadrifasciata TaxID=166423 RepID=A0A0M9A8H3_9HYME|nr:hypothetical protein WN51_05972 [Melipona quadrifasciata]